MSVRLIRFAALLLALLCIGAPASAQDLGAALDKFAADSFSDTEAAIAGIAASGSPQGPAILEALGDRRLFAVAGAKTVFYKDKSDKAFDARTGQPLDGVPADAFMVRLNNRLRNVVHAALGSMTLMSPDPARRISGG